MRYEASPGVRRILPALALGFACSAQAAGHDPLAWLQRATQAARQASYEGTYVHTNGDRVSTVRVTHVNQGGEEHERIEPLDGSNALEIVRRNDEMFCRFPDAKTVRLDPRITNRFFPAILSAGAETIAASYDVKLGKTERVLGHECQWLRLEPRDGLRFTQRLCSEVNTGLILRAKVMNDQKHVIEQYTFTDLKIGPSVARTDLKSIFRARNRQWISDGQPRDEAANVESGWTVTKAPAGFQKIAELKRTLPGRAQPVSQIVLTDGLASLSVFVEPNTAPSRTGEASSEDGTTTFFVRPMGELMVTVLGEVPLSTAQLVGRSVARR
ncbi:MAG TPA: MucB/RseB C-terminal domain-containing protein [Usitatibacter sp.]|nr:MucB/RseB C-terminal domain-containing protein [Usitatibacter sp.]